MSRENFQVPSSLFFFGLGNVIIIGLDLGLAFLPEDRGTQVVSWSRGSWDLGPVGYFVGLAFERLMDCGDGLVGVDLFGL
jgi:hypothetical protein